MAAQLAGNGSDFTHPAYTYRVYVQPYPGWWRRWHGRVIARDAAGRNRFWPWRYGRDRDALLRTLRADVERDIGANRDGVEVEVLEVKTTLA